MGCWGTGLYANDVAADLKASFKEWKRLPLDGAGLRALAMEKCHGADDPHNEDHANFWLVLADLFYGYGIEDDETFTRAIAMIDDGVDIEINRALDMASSDLKRRAAVLDKLKSKWAIPNPKPRNRNIFKKPPSLVSTAGDVWIYPTAEGNALFKHWRDGSQRTPDAWNAFVVACATLHLGYYPHYFIVPLHLFTTDRPSLEDCRSAPLGSREVPAEFGPEAVAEQAEPRWRHLGSWVQDLIARKPLTEIRAEKIGTVDIDGERIRSIFYLNEIGDYGHGSGALRPNSDGGFPDYRPAPMDRFLSEFLASK